MKQKTLLACWTIAMENAYLGIFVSKTEKTQVLKSSQVLVLMKGFPRRGC